MSPVGAFLGNIANIKSFCFKSRHQIINIALFCTSVYHFGKDGIYYYRFLTNNSPFCKTMNTLIHCPYCGQEYELDEFVEGVEGECGNCHKHFILSEEVLGLTPNNNCAKEKMMSTILSETTYFDQNTSYSSEANATTKEGPSTSSCSPDPKHPNLFNCPDCEHLVSIYAKICPQCGHPFNQEFLQQKDPAASPQVKPFVQHSAVQTIEKTSKSWKIMELAGAISTILGIVGCFSANDSNCLFLCALGLGFVIVAKVCAWWENG